MQGKREKRRAYRRAKRLARMTGLPQRITRDGETGIILVSTVCDKLTCDTKPDRKHSTSRKTPGRMYYARHPRKRGTLNGGPFGTTVYPSDNETFKIVETHVTRRWTRDAVTGRFTKRGRGVHVTRHK